MLMKCCCTWFSPDWRSLCAKPKAVWGHQANLFCSGTGQWAHSTCCPGPSTLPPRNDDMASEADSLAVIGRKGLQRIWQIESHQQPKLGLCRQPRGSGPPLHMVKRGRKRSNSNPDGKVGPWGSFTSSPHSQDVGKGIISPCCPSFLWEKLGRVYKNLLVETTSPLTLQLASAPLATSQQSPNQNHVCFTGLRVVRGRQGGQTPGMGDQGQWPFFAVPGKQGLSSKHPAQAQ